MMVSIALLRSWAKVRNCLLSTSGIFGVVSISGLDAIGTSGHGLAPGHDTYWKQNRGTDVVHGGR